MGSSIHHISALTDAMLGGLTRWLRVVGMDTLYNPAEDDRDLVCIADAEERVLLTRDKHLVEHLRPAQSLLITTDTPLEQLHQVVTALRLNPPAELFTRCLKCNATLCSVNGEEAEHLLASGAMPPVRQCPQCHRYYWAGSHTRRMRQALHHTLPGWIAAGASKSRDSC